MFFTALVISSLLGISVGSSSAGKTMKLDVSSSAFSEGQSIPEKYTCDGQNVSPPIKWSGAPANTKSIAIICEDPDAPSGTFTHWVLYNLPGTTKELAEGSSGGGKEGMNDFGKKGYGGPCPPPGRPHRYYFRVYALDTASLGDAGRSKEEVTAVMQGHILAQGQLMARYKRNK
jgi:Raf kinase inhibitor-like YbhB/YbcL family protein